MKVMLNKPDSCEAIPVKVVNIDAQINDMLLTTRELCGFRITGLDIDWEKGEARLMARRVDCVSGEIEVV